VSQLVVALVILENVEMTPSGKLLEKWTMVSARVPLVLDQQRTRFPFSYSTKSRERQLAATQAVRIDGVSRITGSHESPLSRLT
jgi:hypothetical protein